MDSSALVGAILVLSLLATARWGQGASDATTAACAANLQALTRAWTLYAQDNQGLLPNNFTITSVMDTVGRREYATWANNVMDWTVAPANTNVSLVMTGQLARYVEGPGIYRCPDDKFVSAPQRQRGWTGRARSYSMSGFMGALYRTGSTGDADGLNSFYLPFRQFRQLNSMPNPSGLFVFLDEHPDSINDGVFFQDPQSRNSWVDLPSALHGNAANFSFADGHVETRAWSATNSIPPVRFQFLPTILRGPGTNDLAWVRDRQTVLATTLVASRVGQDGKDLRLIWSQVPGQHLMRRDRATDGAWVRETNGLVETTGQREITVPMGGTAEAYFQVRRP